MEGALAERGPFGDRVTREMSRLHSWLSPKSARVPCIRRLPAAGSRGHKPPSSNRLQGVDSSNQGRHRQARPIIAASQQAKIAQAAGFWVRPGMLPASINGGAEPPPCARAKPEAYARPPGPAAQRQQDPGTATWLSSATELRPASGREGSYLPRRPPVPPGTSAESSTTAEAEHRGGPAEATSEDPQRLPCSNPGSAPGLPASCNKNDPSTVGATPTAPAGAKSARPAAQTAPSGLHARRAATTRGGSDQQNRERGAAPRESLEGGEVSRRNEQASGSGPRQKGSGPWRWNAAVAAALMERRPGRHGSLRLPAGGDDRFRHNGSAGAGLRSRIPPPASRTKDAPSLQ